MNEIGIIIAPYIGGAELFFLKKCLKTRTISTIYASSSVYDASKSDASFKSLNIIKCKQFDGLARKISLKSICRAKNFGYKLPNDKNVVFANARSSLVGIAKGYNSGTVYIHDNFELSNIKFKMLLLLIMAAFNKIVFPSNFSIPSVINNRIFKNKTFVEYFDNLEFELPNCAISNDSITVAMIGRIGPAKNQLDAIEIVNLLPFNKKTIIFVGLVLDQGYLTKLISLSESYGINFINKCVPNTDIPNVISDVDFVIHTSKIEVLPLAMFETFANHKLFFAYPVGAIPEKLPEEFWLQEDDYYQSSQIIQRRVCREQ